VICASNATEAEAQLYARLAGGSFMPILPVGANSGMSAGESPRAKRPSGLTVFPADTRSGSCAITDMEKIRTRRASLSGAFTTGDAKGLDGRIVI